MTLEVGGEDGFNDEEPEPLEFCAVQVREEVVLWAGEEEGPSGRRVVVLQYTTVVVQHRLLRGTRRSE